MRTRIHIFLVGMTLLSMDCDRYEICSSQKDCGFCRHCHNGKCLDDPIEECTCPGNWDPETRCLSCLPNWNITSDCATCLGNWDIESNCTTCLGNWDIASSCNTYLSGWAGDNCEKYEFVTISAGGFHTCGLTADNSVICWGSDSFGQSNPP
jgi:hypothetical protein